MVSDVFVSVMFSDDAVVSIGVFSVMTSDDALASDAFLF